MGSVLKVISPINWAIFIVVFLILAGGLYNFIESPSFLAGMIILLFIFILIFLLFARHELSLDASGVGVAAVKQWTLEGVKNYNYQGLSKAKDIIKVDIGGSESEVIKWFLLFDDGYRLPIPGNDANIEEIMGWFQDNYGNSISVKEGDSKTIF